MSTFLDVVQSIATVIIAICACLGLRQWKNELRGHDKYKALIDIKVKLLTFKNLYQNARLNIIRQISRISENDYLVIKEYYHDNIKRLWGSYNTISDAINIYTLLEPTQKYFLQQELNDINQLISYYALSIEFYCDYKAKKIQLDDDGLNEVEKYALKYTTENDEISISLFDIVNNAFNKIDLLLKKI